MYFSIKLSIIIFYKKNAGGISHNLFLAQNAPHFTVFLAVVGEPSVRQKLRFVNNSILLDLFDNPVGYLLTCG
jgi:hypothetical protein